MGREDRTLRERPLEACMLLAIVSVAAVEGECYMQSGTYVACPAGGTPEEHQQECGSSKATSDGRKGRWHAEVGHRRNCACSTLNRCF